MDGVGLEQFLQTGFRNHATPLTLVNVLMTQVCPLTLAKVPVKPQASIELAQWGPKA